MVGLKPLHSGFNPRLALAGEATNLVAKLEREGSRFQSAPRPRGRGDAGCECRSSSNSLFQSAPRPRGRGDWWVSDLDIDIDRVSIRASPSRARRPDSKESFGVYFEFQSAPRPRGRGDRNLCAANSNCICFNPRLALAGEATNLQRLMLVVVWVSIRASPSRARRRGKRT